MTMKLRGRLAQIFGWAKFFLPPPLPFPPLDLSFPPSHLFPSLLSTRTRAVGSAVTPSGMWWTRSPSGKRIWCIYLALKSDVLWHKFY